jgi:uncharacterized protein (DUF1697 family)
MPVIIGLLRGVNVGGHHKLKMDVLRDVCVSSKLECVQTHLQSGNVVFRANNKDLRKLEEILGTAIERRVGFRPALILRTIPELRAVVAHNPFAKRPGLEPGKLVVAFLGASTSVAAGRQLLAMDIAPEELRVHGSELYIYFPNGQARPKLSWPRVEKILDCSYTARNWNTVTKLLEIAEGIESES